MIWPLLIQLCLAGTIGIQSTSEFKFLQNKKNTILHASIAVKNSGDELARQVNIELIEPRFRDPLNSQNIEAGDKFIWSFESEIDPHFKGEMPIVFVVNYQDVNGYKFSAPSVAIAKTGGEQSLPPQEQLQVNSTVEQEADGEYKIRYFIKNTTADKLAIQSRLILPKEIKLQTQEVPLEILANTEIEISYQVSGQKALPGSRYNVFLILVGSDSSGQRVKSHVESLLIKERDRAGFSFRFEDLVLAFLGLVLATGALYLYRNWFQRLSEYK